MLVSIIFHLTLERLSRSLEEENFFVHSGHVLTGNSSFICPTLTCTCTIMPWIGLKTIKLITSLNTESLRSKDGQTMARGERVTSHSHLKHEQSYYVVHYSKREGRKKEMDKHWQSTTAPKGLEKKIILYIHIPSLSSLETYVHLGLSSLETYLET